MQTACPECTSTISLPNPDTDPGTFARCDGCGDRVQPGAFLCPHCQTGLQVERSLLPADGGHGRCPDCSEAVWVPPLTETTATSDVEMENEALDAMSPVLGDSVQENATPDATPQVLGDSVPETVAPDSFVAPPAEETHGSFAAAPAKREEEVQGGRRVLGLFLGGFFGAGAALGVILNGVWVPPELPWDAEFLFANLISWAGFSGLAGALLGLMLGGRRRS
jgi:predicted Zn finger-like uncharacterized protein